MCFHKTGVYLLHFDTNLAHARHYLGYAADIERRLAEHAAGQGARLTAVCRERHITWRLARTWPGTRQTERRLKRQHNSPRLCPICNPELTTTEARRPRQDGPPMTPCAECGTLYPPAALVAGTCLACLYGPAGPWPRLEELHLLASALVRQELAAFNAYTRRPTDHHLRAWRDARAALQDNQDEYAALYAAWCATAPESRANQTAYPL